MGKSSFAVLAFPVSLRYGLDGRKSFCVCTFCFVWYRSVNGSNSLLDTAAAHHRITRSRFSFKKGNRKRLEGENITSPVLYLDSHGFLVSMDISRHLRSCSDYLAMSPTGALKKCLLIKKYNPDIVINNEYPLESSPAITILSSINPCDLKP